MPSHSEKTRAAILAPRAPRDLEWDRFVEMWQEFADRIEQEPGDRLAVDMNGHREVFHRTDHDDVSIEDIERARHLLRAEPDDLGAGDLLVVTIDNRSARIIDFSLDTPKTDARTTRIVDEPDPTGRHMRTVERQTGRDDEHDLVGFYEDLARRLTNDFPGRSFVLFGHGHGKADTAAGFVARMQQHHKDVHQRIAATTSIDLSAASDTDLERAARALMH
jgi:hypothetical protein